MSAIVLRALAGLALGDIIADVATEAGPGCTSANFGARPLDPGVSSAVDQPNQLVSFGGVDDGGHGCQPGGWSTEGVGQDIVRAREVSDRWRELLYRGEPPGMAVGDGRALEPTGERLVVGADSEWCACEHRAEMFDREDNGEGLSVKGGVASLGGRQSAREETYWATVLEQDGANG